MAEMMLAARCNAYGPPDSVVIEKVPVPEPEPDQVVVEVHAAAVNYPDVLIVANKYQVSMPVPFTPGSEVAGVVLSVGDDVARDPGGLRPGDRVFGSMFVGAFAQQVALPAWVTMKLPHGTDFAEAAAFGVTYFTAYHSLRTVAEVQPGEWVVVLGAAGGVGLAAVELGKVLGAKVLAAASTPEKLTQCEAQGADAVVDYTTEDLRLRIRELTDGGADVVIDPVGGPWAEQALRSTRFGGRFVTVGYASGEIPRIPLNLVLLKGAIIKGFEFRTFGEHCPDEMRRDRGEMLELFAQGRIHPHISAVYPLSEVAQALDDLAERRAVGKVLIDPTR